MITFLDLAAKEPETAKDKCVDPELWHACAGRLIQIPPVSSKVYYFPQGHAEHTHGHIELPAGRVPALILCSVDGVRFLADPDTDEVFAKIRLAPVRPDEPGSGDADDGTGAAAYEEKPAFFVKMLTQSDANNGGGFSVPRYCAETIFPALDYSADPPVQTVLAKDVHGAVWKFRHIYRGTPRRHLLTTGWSSFVNRKKLVAGDSVLFMRTERGELSVGIRRAKKAGAGMLPPLPGHYGRFSRFLREEEDSSKMMAARPEEVVEAANLLASGQPFEVVYYPRACTPEFCVNAAAVRTAMRTRWCPGMRFKMPFEMEDSSRISWFVGTVSAARVADPVRWPNSPWRLLEVIWDEPHMLGNVKRVSPWLIEPVSTIHLLPYSPPRKKLCVPWYPDLPLEVIGSPLCRARFGLPLSDLHLTKMQPSLSPNSLHQIGGVQPTINGDPIAREENKLCSLPQEKKRSDDNKETPRLMLFGRPILTEQQICSTGSTDNVSGGQHENRVLDLWLGTGHCKVFMESQGIGRTLDLSAIGSYDELYRRLADMFDLEESELTCHISYHDSTGAHKFTGEVPFSDFTKTARRLTILMDKRSHNFAMSEKAPLSCTTSLDGGTCRRHHQRSP